MRISIGFEALPKMGSLQIRGLFRFGIQALKSEVRLGYAASA